LQIRSNGAGLSVFQMTRSRSSTPHDVIDRRSSGGFVSRKFAVQIRGANAGQAGRGSEHVKAAVEMPRCGRRWKTLGSQKTARLRDFHIPTAPTIFFISQRGHF
jgi:hypothetical protein